MVFFNTLIFNTNNNRTRAPDVYDIVIMTPAEFYIIIIAKVNYFFHRQFTEKPFNINICLVTEISEHTIIFF